ncbi:MAG: SAM-dependent methyltransferase [Bacteroidota bacterium]
MSKSGTLYMMPCPIVEDGISTLSADSIDHLHQLTHFVVERARTARRFIKSTGHPTPISELQIFELDKNDPTKGLHNFLNYLQDGIDIGVLSEAGCPGIADPGNLAVQYAHRYSIRVSPLVGPSSILLALIASGLNGQNFAFNGYLPNKGPELIKKLKRLEQKVKNENQTQIFMEAPYRNEFILSHCLKVLSSEIKLCVACDINASNEFIWTKKISDWIGTNWKEYHKRPAIFLIGR